MWATATGKRPDCGSVQFSPMYISSCTFQSPPNSCRTPHDSAGLQAKVLILVASPAKLGRVGQSLEELGRT